MAKRKKSTRSQPTPPTGDSAPDESSDPGPVGDRLARVTVPPQLNSPRQRRLWGLPENEEDPGPYMVELNLQHASGLSGAASAFLQLHQKLATERSGPIRVGKTYFACNLSVDDWRNLIQMDEREADLSAGKAGSADPVRYRAIYRIWPDFPIKGLVDRSVATIKGDAAVRAFDAAGEGIVWAVIDSGVNADHPHFGDAITSKSRHTLLSGGVSELHRCLCAIPQVGEDGVSISMPLPDPDADPAMKPEKRNELVEKHRKAALSDPFGHGTHVAGIIAGGLPEKPTFEVRVLERQFKLDGDGKKISKSYGGRTVENPANLRGVAPRCKLVSLRVLDEEGNGRASGVMRALEYIREQLNDDPKVVRVHGVNLSVGYEFDAEMFACGQSPVCAEVDRLVQAGVVVVTAAGNTGYGTIAAQQRAAKVGLSNTINDPGNAASAITVGSTHRDSPHTYGVSYFSSKGPTGDGRLKPDLVAPGERITSCAAGKKLDDAIGVAKPPPANGPGGAVSPAGADTTAYYVDDSGTSMAAPHVSGAVAAFLSIRREFIGKPHEVKRIFLTSATPLGRERYFEGHGLVDLMRAIQAV